MLLAPPALLPINYNSDSPVILGINTSHITICFLLCQYDADNPCICRYMHFGSTTLNDCESHFSQPKLELYSLFCALHTLKMYLIGVWKLLLWFSLLCTINQHPYLLSLSFRITPITTDFESSHMTHMLTHTHLCTLFHFPNPMPWLPNKPHFPL